MIGRNLYRRVGGCRYDFPLTITIMAWRKRVLDDGDSDSSAGRSDDDNVDFGNDPDLRDERELFQDPYRCTRRRKNCKDYIWCIRRQQWLRG